MKRLFVSFAMEDIRIRDLFVGQARNAGNDIEFTDYSVKQAWSESWKTNCRARIRSCRGVVGLITSNTPKASGQLWELKCAKEEGLPILLLYPNATRPTSVPYEIKGMRIYGWTHDTLKSFIARI